jgi:hypothetical protein
MKVGLGGAMLTPDKLELYKQRAEAGDSQAAFVLYEHYEELGEAQEANKWLLASLSDNDVRLDDLPDGVPVSGNDRFRLQPTEINAKLAAAGSGDMPSAEALYLHYSFGEYDAVLSEKWRLTAASLGSERAQCAMAVAFMDAVPPDLSQARTWAAAAEAAGSQRGSELVRTIDKRLKDSR